MSECTCHKNYTLDTLIPKVGVITDIREETPDVKTFRVNAPEGGKLFEHMPGQCAMLCAPGVSEGMFSITSSPTNKEYQEFSIKKCGQLTDYLHSLEVGDEITVRGRIQICQKQIVWQDDQTKKIVSLWATVEKPYYSNLSENKVMSYSTREFRIQTPFDEYSARLNIGKRLMLEIVNGEPKTYRITSIDQMTGRIDYDNDQIGFLSFNVEQDLYNAETDNVEKMICNYVPEDASDNVEITYPDDNTVDDRVLSIEFTGEPSIPTGGFGKLFTAKIDGEVYDGAE